MFVNGIFIKVLRTYRCVAARGRQSGSSFNRTAFTISFIKEWIILYYFTLTLSSRAHNLLYIFNYNEVTLQILDKYSMRVYSSRKGFLTKPNIGISDNLKITWQRTYMHMTNRINSNTTKKIVCVKVIIIPRSLTFFQKVKTLYLILYILFLLYSTCKHGTKYYLRKNFVCVFSFALDCMCSSL